MHFTLVGAGAVGTLWGLKLQDAGHHVHFWTRAEQASLTRGFESLTEQHFPANNANLLADSDCILVCVKAFQVDTALDSLLPYLHQDTPVILMHNGMGTAQSALEKLGSTPLLLATTSQASLLLSETTVRHTGIGETRLGGINPSGKRCDFLAEVLNHALPPCTWESKIEQALWQKLAINCMINPLTGIFQIQNGELTKPEYSDQLHQLASEIALVMQAKGIDTDSDTVLQRALSVANATATNYSSMNRDVFYKRPSEIEAITGYLIHCASRHSIATPENQSLYLAIKNLEQSYDHP